jgi:hypothetical protein
MNLVWNKLVAAWNWLKELVIQEAKPVKKKKVKKSK